MRTMMPDADGSYAYYGMAYANADAPTQIANGVSTTSLSFDGDGNLTSAGTSTFSWDYRKSADPGGDARFDLDVCL